jgi:hypothetical protein
MTPPAVGRGYQLRKLGLIASSYHHRHVTAEGKVDGPLRDGRAAALPAQRQVQDMHGRGVRGCRKRMARRHAACAPTDGVGDVRVVTATPPQRPQGLHARIGRNADHALPVVGSRRDDASHMRSVPAGRRLSWTSEVTRIRRIGVPAIAVHRDFVIRKVVAGNQLRDHIRMRQAAGVDHAHAHAFACRLLPHIGQVDAALSWRLQAPLPRPKGVIRNAHHLPAHVGLCVGHIGRAGLDAFSQGAGVQQRNAAAELDDL